MYFNHTNIFETVVIIHSSISAQTIQESNTMKLMQTTTRIIYEPFTITRQLDNYENVDN